MGVRNDRLFEVLLYAGSTAPIGRNQLDLHAGSVLARPVDRLFVNDVGLIAFGVIRYVS